MLVFPGNMRGFIVLMYLLPNLCILRLSTSLQNSPAWITNVTYNYVLLGERAYCRKVLQVSFEHSSMHTNDGYKLSLRKLRTSKTQGNVTCQGRGDEMEPPEVQRTSNNEANFTKVSPGTFCLAARPLTSEEGGTCKRECRWQIIGPIRLEVMPQQSCEKWCGDLHLRPDVSTIIVKFTVFHEFVDCFHFYNIFLLNTSLGFCPRRGLVEVERRERVSSGDVVTFEDLQPGNYCVHVEAVNRSIQRGRLHKLHGFVVLPPLPGVRHNETEIRTAESRGIVMITGHLWLYVSIFLTVSVVVVVVLLLWFCCSKRKSRDAPCKNKTTEVALAPEPVRACRHKIKVLLLYFHDSEEFEELVDRFVVLLRRRWQVEVIVDKEEEHFIYVNHAGWILNKLSSFWCSDDEEDHDDCIRKVVVIESEGALNWKNAREKQASSKDDGDCDNGILNEVCQYGLTVIANNPNSLSAHGMLLVVRFKCTPETLYLNNFVPNKRYTIPDHSLDFYCALHNVDVAALWTQSDPLHSTDWKYSEEFRWLEEQVKKMTDVCTMQT